MKRIIDIPEEKYNQIINKYQGSKVRPKDYEIDILNSIPLGQEPSEDCISRQAAQNKIKKICNKYGLSYENGERKPSTGGLAYALGHAFDDLPPVTKQENYANIPYLMHKEMNIPLLECKKAYDVAIEYLRSQAKVKG